jgi:TetR/AcrR family transcriptional repressor of nem operon
MKYYKEAIIDKGIELMRKEGYHAVGVREILLACKIPKGSFYNFFESKNAFVSMAIEQYHQTAVGQIRSDLSTPGKTAYQRITFHFEQLSRYYQEQHCTQGCLFINLSSEIGATNDVLARQLESKYEEWMDLLAQEIKKGQQAGEIIAQVEAKKLANYLYNSYNGAVTRMKIQRNAAPLVEFLEINLSLIRA